MDSARRPLLADIVRWLYALASQTRRKQYVKLSLGFAEVLEHRFATKTMSFGVRLTFRCVVARRSAKRGTRVYLVNVTVKCEAFFMFYLTLA